MPLPQDHLHSAPPVLAEPDAVNFDLRTQMAQDDVGRRVKAQRWGDQQQTRWTRTEGDAREIAVARELLPRILPAHAKPIIHCLQRHVNVFLGLEFKHGWTRVSRN